MLHLKNSSNLNRKMAKDILRESRRLASGMDLILRDCRISKKYVEIDTSIQQSSLDQLIEKLSPIGPLDHAKHVVEEIVEKEQAISDGISYFNNERFWECRIFNRALTKLENSNGQYHNIDIDKIKKTVTEMINSKDVSSFLI